MLLEIAATLLLGTWLFWLGMRLGKVLLRQGVTANDLFKGKALLSFIFLGVYVGLLVLALNLPQWQLLPLDWRVHGMRISWTAMRILLLGFCGTAFVVSWQTAKTQVLAVILIGLLGVGGFSGVEAYVLAPIHASLGNNLQANGVYKQTSASSCAPAALATVLRLWGIDATESSVARLAGTSRLGTSMPQLIMAARALNMDGLELSPTWEQMQQINRPGILGVWLFDGMRKAPHAVALLALDTDTATIADPARGRIYHLNRTQFNQVWRQQYVPIFSPTETLLTPEQAAEQLARLGYFSQVSGELSQAIRSFQTAVGVKVTGELDPETVLLISGSSLSSVPTLTKPSLEIVQIVS
ncbi:peptidoglycan-binding protein [Oculatella sp. FACHB-28]|nr:peptidoglycan-binding protein [Cyanobacteria bacterium FACHB-471]MBD2056963.1 peptidoglycan-binding protein [Oculatella sp. FACHB-28]